MMRNSSSSHSSSSSSKLGCVVEYQLLNVEDRIVFRCDAAAQLMQLSRLKATAKCPSVHQSD
jgi:hypothetical protein